MLNFDYFKKERVILSIVIEIEDEYLHSSEILISYIQTQIKSVYHVVLDRALYDNVLHGTNLIILYTLDMRNSYMLVCNNSSLTMYSKNHLLFNYNKFVKSKRIVLYYGLQP